MRVVGARKAGEVVPRLVLAAPRGRAGKTSIAIGLLAAWRRQGVDVLPFKKGPDFIDAAWLAQAAGRPCHNLDAFLLGFEGTCSSFRERVAGHRQAVAVIEGNMGLYDGLDLAGSGSTAELAKALAAPVVVIIDVTRQTRTAAAVVKGLQVFDRAVPIVGVILNRVARSRQEILVRTAIEQHCGLPVLGAVPRVENPYLGERHLGLVPPVEHRAAVEAVNFLGELAEKYLDLPALHEVATAAPPLPLEDQNPRKAAPGTRPKDVRIGVIRDAAFQFYYPENLEALERQGAELVEISALTSPCLPAVDALYIGGGFPETQAAALAANASFRASLRQAVERGMPVYAECGGLMYLGESLLLAGVSYPMVGVFPVSFTVERRPQGHGYTVLEVQEANPYFPLGTVLRGHEFHYSRPRPRQSLPLAFRVRRGAGFDGRGDGLVYKNTLACYTHLHALGTPQWAERLVSQARRYALERRGAAGISSLAGPRA